MTGSESTVETLVVDGVGSVRVLVGGRYAGLVKYHKVSRGASAGWQTEGCVTGPCARRRETVDEAITDLIQFTVARRQNPEGMSAVALQIPRHVKEFYWRERPEDGEA